MALVPLYVDGGQIWVLLSRSGSPSEGASFPSTSLTNGEEMWAGAQRAGATLDIDVDRMMPLGELDQVETPTGEVLVPCVAVVPPPDADGYGSRERAPLPLVAAKTPSLVEERSVKVGDQEVWFRLAHIGPIKLAGAGVDILENLLERVFHD